MKEKGNNVTGSAKAPYAIFTVIGLIAVAACGGSNAASTANATTSASAKPNASTATPTTEPSSSDAASPQPVATRPGTAQVQLKADSGTHTYSIICYRSPRSVFLASPNIPLALLSDGSMTNSLIPEDDGPWMYLIVDPGTEVHGQSIDYETTADTDGLSVQGGFGTRNFGGSADYLQSAHLRVSSNGRSGDLTWSDRDGTGFTAKWRC